MIKTDELAKADSCLNKAKDDEMLFVLRAHDAVAAATIRFWTRLRIEYRLNSPGDEQIREALECAKTMEHQRIVELI